MASGSTPSPRDQAPPYCDSAREPKKIWLAPGAGHTGGIEARPQEYERRVVAFFDDALLGS